MRRAIVLSAALAALAGGCKKALDTSVGPDEKPKVVPSPYTPVAPGSGAGGSGGAVQDVRGAVVRTVVRNDLDVVKKYMELFRAESGKLPTKAELVPYVQKD